jgi:hypothetical protein
VVRPGLDIGDAVLKAQYQFALPTGSVEASRSVSRLPNGRVCNEYPPSLRLSIRGLALRNGNLGDQILSANRQFLGILLQGVHRGDGDDAVFSFDSGQSWVTRRAQFETDDS